MKVCSYCGSPNCPAIDNPGKGLCRPHHDAKRDSERDANKTILKDGTDEQIDRMARSIRQTVEGFNNPQTGDDWADLACRVILDLSKAGFTILAKDDYDALVKKVRLDPLGGFGR